MTACLVIASLLSAANVYNADKVPYNNNEIDEIGSWDNWMTSYHVNDKHDGYLDIGSTSFNPSNLNLTYAIQTDCTAQTSLFVNGRIYCVSNNIVLSYFASNGSLSFFYVTIDSQCIASPAFAKSTLSSSVIAYSLCSTQTSPHIYAFDPISGKQIIIYNICIQVIISINDIKIEVN